MTESTYSLPEKMYMLSGVNQTHCNQDYYNIEDYLIDKYPGMNPRQNVKLTSLIILPFFVTFIITRC